MSWWSRLFGRGPKEPPPAKPAPAWPAVVEIVPGELVARVWHHDVPSPRGAVPCVSIVSDGLRRHGQQEVVFTLRRRPEEEGDGFPESPIQLIEQFAHLAAEGRTVTVGDGTEFRGDPPMGRHLIYAQAQPLAGVDVPHDALAAVLVTDAELRAWKEFGALRVLARKGQAASWFPFPPWSDRDDRGVDFRDEFAQSFLTRCPTTSLASADVTKEGDRFVLRVAPPGREHLAAAAEGAREGGALGLLPSLSPNADACLVWAPGQTGPEAISAPAAQGRRVGGCFLVVVGEGSDALRVLEDGFAVTLSDANWRGFLDALAGWRPWSCECRGATLAFEPLPEVFESPFGERVHASGGWRSYTPDAPQPRGPAPRLEGTTLLTPEEEIAAAVSIEALSRHLLTVEAAVLPRLSPAAPFDRLAVRCTLRPGAAPTYAVATRGPPDEPALRAMCAALDALDAPAVKGPLAVELQFVTREPS
ncbi:MAG: hypothetical protein U0324_01495 [Polyangiales bacterium]